MLLRSHFSSNRTDEYGNVSLNASDGEISCIVDIVPYFLSTVAIDVKI